jgi:hypothetical protein
MGFLDNRFFSAALIWLFTLGICYLADADGVLLAAIPISVAIVFLLIFRE